MADNIRDMDDDMVAPEDVDREEERVRSSFDRDQNTEREDIGSERHRGYDDGLRERGKGEDIDPDSGLPHIVKCLASLVVLRDAQINGKLTDDRPPSSPEWAEALNKMAGELIDKYPEAKQAFIIGEKYD